LLRLPFEFRFELFLPCGVALRPKRLVHNLCDPALVDTLRRLLTGSGLSLPRLFTERGSQVD
jgi:hypothetical protein